MQTEEALTLRARICAFWFLQAWTLTNIAAVNAKAVISASMAISIAQEITATFAAHSLNFLYLGLKPALTE